jgi:serine/threonine-protein kinase
VIAAFAGASGLARNARADDNSALVEQLFADGKKLMTAGKPSEACPKFLASYNLEHRVGTLLALADCYEQNKQFASAWARFIEARTLATRNGQPERADYANKHAASLEPRRSMLTIAVGSTLPGLVVRLDGALVEPAVYGVAVPVDGGSHAIEATATGKAPLEGSVNIAPEADQKTYTLPVLADAAVAPPASLSAAAAVPAGRAASSHLTTRAITGIAIAGVGVVLAGVGTYFGVAALGKKSDSAPYCGADGQKDDCFGPGVGLRSDAVSDATVSSVLLGVGAAAVASGVVLWVTAPSPGAQATVGFDGHMLRLGGTF